MIWIASFATLAFLLWPEIWYRVVHQHVAVEAEILRHQVSVGDAVTVTFVLSNRAWLPCPFIRLHIELPEGLSALPDSVTRSLDFTTHLWMKEAVRLEATCFAVARGPQSFVNKEGLIYFHEGIGLRERFLTFRVKGELIVLPDLGKVTLWPEVNAVQGNLEVHRWLHPDESRLRGIREYAAGDSYKRISWNATASTGTLMVKEYMSSTEPSMCLMFNAQLTDPHWLGTNRRTFDELAESVASLAANLERQGADLCFLSNGVVHGSRQKLWFGPQSSRRIRRLLGSMLPIAHEPLERMLELANKTLPVETPIILVSAFQTEGQGQLLARLESHRRVVPSGRYGA